MSFLSHRPLFFLETGLGPRAIAGTSVPSVPTKRGATEHALVLSSWVKVAFDLPVIHIQTKQSNRIRRYIFVLEVQIDVSKSIETDRLFSDTF
jgi:hypothetical protein